MAFIGFALLIAAGLTLIISSDAGSLAGLSQDQVGQLIPLLLVLILVASASFGRRIAFSQMLTGLVLWAGIFIVALAGYSYRYEIAGFSNRLLGEFSPGAAVIDETGGIARFRRGFGDTFRMQATINGAPVTMIFDTGASVVVLTGRDARAAGISLNGLRFTVPVQTANGMGKAAIVALDRIEVGGITRRNIRAFVAEPGALDTSLLGMSYLRTLKAYSVSRDTLELKG